MQTRAPRLFETSRFPHRRVPGLLSCLLGALAIGGCAPGGAGGAPEGTQDTEADLTVTATVPSNYVPCADPTKVADPPKADDLTTALPDAPVAYEATATKQPSLVFAPAAPSLTLSATVKTTSTLETTDAPVPDLGKADAPGSCLEQALNGFGPLPADMPAVKWPEMNWCTDSECPKVKLAWLRTHHSAWRLAQMFEFMNDLGEAQRSFAWGQPGVDASGEAGHPMTSPSYWFGGYDAGRFATTLDVVRKYWKVVREAETGGIDIRLQCPRAGEQDANPCVSVPLLSDKSPGATHWVKGYINICQEAFSGDTNNEIQTRVDNGMVHEPLHHLFGKQDGVLKALTDTKFHAHGVGCGLTPKSETFYFNGIDEGIDDTQLAHLREYEASNGSTCSHRNKLVLTVDSYAQFARAVGTLVKGGQIVSWPKWGDPTPHPPECTGDIGCLCDPVPAQGAPDGDYSPTKYCFDTEAEPTVCMETTFNASETVGICTNCADVRGPGCACNEVTQPCDVGFCWGEDTGPGNVDGTCYRDPPPDWACLANCEYLMGSGASCMHDHPDGARCVPYGVGLPDAYACWMDDGGYINPNGDCDMYECGHPDSSPAYASCQDLGYPGTFVCDQGAFRCMPNP